MFDERHASLRYFVCGTKYASQKDRLRADFEQFLRDRADAAPSCATAASLQTATSLDVVRFLFSREKGGRTTVHELAYPHLGKAGLFDCGCPRRFAAGTVDSYVGMLRAVFKSGSSRSLESV